MEKWEDITILNENVLKSHATFDYEKTIDLNGTWDYYCIKGTDNLPKDLDCINYETIEVPSSVEPKGYSQAYYYGANFPPAINKKKIPSIDHKQTHVSIYHRNIEIEDNYLSDQTILRFDSVKSAFHCYLNEEYIGMAKCSMLPIEFDVTKFIKEGNNDLKVIVYQFSDVTYLEDQDMWFLSGIDRDVKLYTRSKDHFEDIYVHCELINDYKDARLFIETENSTDQGEISVEINDISNHYLIDAFKTHIEILLQDVKLWSAETPYLYPIRISLNDTDTQIINYGFKEVKVDHDKGLFLFNGKPIKLRGMNYHAFTPDCGHYVPREVYEKDLKLMKKHNINAIRTSHYPQADYFYDLCDRYGIYVMDEANVESHGVRNKVPKDDPLWTKQVTDRMARMVLRDRNHPCVTIWSLGNESDIGTNHFKMREAALLLDQSRPIHYEGGGNLQVSDFLCIGYSPLQREQRFANSEDVENQPTIIQRLIPLMMTNKSVKFEDYKHHPAVATEYNYCMGNSSCDVDKHIKLFDQSDRWCGGFVWDFKDKSLRINDRFVYGGDLTKKDQKGNICCDGACDPDSKPHSVFYEIQHAFQEIVCEYQNNKLSIYNRNFFKNASAYRCLLQISHNGKILEEQELQIDVKPRWTKEYEIPFDTDLNQKGLYCLNVLFLQKEDDEAYLKDEIRSYDQFILKDDHKEEKVSSDKIIEHDTHIELCTSNARYLIDRKNGDLIQITARHKDLLSSPLRPVFYRAITDGEAGFIGIAMGSYKKLDAFGKLSMDSLKNASISIEANKIIVKNLLKELELTRTYSLVNDKLLVQADLKTKKKAPNRFGMSLETDKEYSRFLFLGRGPHDSYWARKDSGMISLYEQSVLDQDEYVRPQEHGNKTDVYFLNLLNEKNEGIVVERNDEPFSASVWPYTLKDLHEAQHIDELPSYAKTTLNIDCIQNGLGDCFVRCPDEYKIKPNSEYHYSFYLSVK